MWPGAGLRWPVPSGPGARRPPLGPGRGWGRHLSGTGTDCYVGRLITACAAPILTLLNTEYMLVGLSALSLFSGIITAVYAELL